MAKRMQSVLDRGNDQVSIGVEYSKTAWSYQPMSVSTLLYHLRQQPDHCNNAYHEVIEGPCKLFYDLDMDFPSNRDDFDSVTFMNQFNQLVHDHILDKYDIPMDCREVLWFARAVFSTKISFHVIYPRIWLPDRRCIIPLVIEMDSTDVDCLVYTTGNLRVPYSTKFQGNDQTRLIPFPSLDSEISRDLLTRGLITHGPMEGFIFKQNVIAPLTHSPKGEFHLELSTDDPRYDAINTILGWFTKSWGSFKFSSVSKTDDSTYSVRNAMPSYCKQVKRCHKSNRTYMSIKFNDQAKQVHVSVYCTDCKIWMPFTFCDLSRLVYPI